MFIRSLLAFTTIPKITIFGIVITEKMEIAEDPVLTAGMHLLSVPDPHKTHYPRNIYRGGTYITSLLNNGNQTLIIPEISD